MTKLVQKSDHTKEAQSVLKSDDFVGVGLWQSLQIETLPVEEKLALLEEVNSTVERRWLRRISSKLVDLGLNPEELAASTPEERLEIVQKHVPESLEMLFEEVENIRHELIAVAAD